MIFFFNDTATTEIYTLSLHDALPIYARVLLDPRPGPDAPGSDGMEPAQRLEVLAAPGLGAGPAVPAGRGMDRCRPDHGPRHAPRRAPARPHGPEIGRAHV